MDRNRIVNARTDALADEVFPQHVTLLRANHIEVPNRFRASSLTREYDSTPLQEFVIEDSIPATGGVPLFEVFQLDAEHGGLQRVETAIVTPEHVLIFFLLAVIAQHLQTFRYCTVVCDHYAAVAVSAQVFPRIE